MSDCNAEIKDGFSFVDKDTNDMVPLTRWLDKSGHPIPGHPELPVERAAEINKKVLTKGDPVPLDLFVCFNLVQQELTRLGINSIALLNKTDHEWKETMQRLTMTERTEKRPEAIRSRVVERDCQSIVNQLVKSLPKDVLLRTSYVERQQLTKECGKEGSVH